MGLILLSGLWVVSEVGRGPSSAESMRAIVPGVGSAEAAQLVGGRRIYDCEPLTEASGGHWPGVGRC